MLPYWFPDCYSSQQSDDVGMPELAHDDSFLEELDLVFFGSILLEDFNGNFLCAMGRRAPHSRVHFTKLTSTHNTHSSVQTGT